MSSALRPGISNDIEGDRIEAAWIESPAWLRSQRFRAVRSRRAHLARQRSILIGRRALMTWVSRGCLVVLCALLCRCTAEPPVVPTPAQPKRLPFTYEAGQNGMRNGGVRAILQDRSGNYWFGSHFEGVCRFDGERFQCFTTADGLGDNQVRSIQEDARGTIWFDNGVGISSYSGGTVAASTARRYDATHAWMLDPSDLWFKSDGTHGFNQSELAPGVYRFDGEGFTYLTFPLPLERTDDDGYSLTGICRGKGGRVWLATYAAVFGFDGRTLTTIDGDRMGLRKEEGAPHVRCVFEDSSGRLWIGNNGVGVVMVDGARTALLAELCADAADADPSLLRVFSIGEDREGCIWIGTIGGGAWRYDGRTLRQFGERDGLTTKDVMAIYRDRAGDLWVGGKGVFRFNGISFDRMY
jgi:ligand-binding sensor domain-containing protein